MYALFYCVALLFPSPMVMLPWLTCRRTRTRTKLPWLSGPQARAGVYLHVVGAAPPVQAAHVVGGRRVPDAHATVVGARWGNRMYTLRAARKY
jgi:hypothetical protein